MSCCNDYFQIDLSALPPKPFSMFSGIRRTCLVVVGYLLPFLPSFAQSSQPAQLLDAGLLFPAYRWELDLPALEALKAHYPTEWATIQEWANEKNWPPGLRNHANRTSNRDFFCQIKAYSALFFGKDKVLLHIPASENQQLPQSLRPNRDIFFIMRASGIALSNTTDGFSASFSEQLGFLLQASLHHFASLTDTTSQSKLGLYGTQRNASHILEGAHHAFIEEALGGNRITYTAVFPATNSQEEAVAWFEKRIQQIQITPLPACPLVRSRETNTELPYFARFFPHDFTGDMDPRFKNLVVTIQVQAEYSTQENVHTTVWHPLLSIQYTP